MPFATASKNRFVVRFASGGTEQVVGATKESWNQARTLTGAALLNTLAARP